MLQFLNPWMLVGLCAIAIPIFIHILHRYRVRATPFAGMRFLDQVMVRLQRQLRWQDALLLFLRCAALGCIAFALSQPLWRSQADYSQLLERQGATAAIVIFDNSASCTKQLDTLKQLAHGYVDTLRSGDAVSILSLNTDDDQILYDFSTAHRFIDRIDATDANNNLSALFVRAQQALQKHVNPHTEIIVITDGQESAWDASCLRHVNNLQDPTQTEDDAKQRVIVLTPVENPQANNSSIRMLNSSQQVTAVGQRCLFSLAIQHQGAVPEHQALVRLRVNNRTIDEQVIDRRSDIEEILHFHYEFTEPGSHIVSAELVGLRDDIPGDNIRHISIAVTERIPVLLIDGENGKQLRYVSLALAAKSNTKNSFQIDHIDLTGVNAEKLAQYPIAILADTAALDSQSIAHLERYIVGGGNVLVFLGARSQTQVINDLWSRNGDGFLPCNIENPKSGDLNLVLYPQCQDVSHAAFSSLPSNTQQLLSASTIYKYVPLLTNDVIRDPNFQTLMTLNNGDPFLVERRRGQGRVLLCASNTQLDWSDLASHAIYVPWMRGLCSYLSSFLLPPRNLECGESIIHLDSEEGQVHISDTQGHVIEHQRSAWQGHQVAQSNIIWQSGAYIARQKQQRTWYAINIPTTEQTLSYINSDWLNEHAPSLVIIQGIAEVEESWGNKQSSAIPLWHMCIVAALLLLFAESFYARRLSHGVQSNG